MKTLLFAVCLFFTLSTRTAAQSIDYDILEEWNIENHTRGMENTFRFFSNNNVFFLIGAPVFMLGDGYISDDKKMITAGKNALVSLGVSTAATWALKYTVRRERPFERYPSVVKLSSGGGYSFPSGHTSSAFAMATSISMSYPKWYIIAPCYLWAGTVGVSRIVLGVHYPSDVLAGALVGMGSAYVTNRANRWLHRNRHAVPAAGQ
jgi:membrane-associated phospholipid phosphatase